MIDVGIRPQCPPGACADWECKFCDPGTFDNAKADKLASGSVDVCSRDVCETKDECCDGLFCKKDGKKKKLGICKKCLKGKKKCRSDGECCDGTTCQKKLNKKGIKAKKSGVCRAKARVDEVCKKDKFCEKGLKCVKDGTKQKTRKSCQPKNDVIEADGASERNKDGDVFG